MTPFILILSFFLLLFSFTKQKTFEGFSEEEGISFEKIYEKVRSLEMKKIVVVSAEGEEILKACRVSKDMGLADFVLCGERKKLNEISKEINVSIADFEIINENDSDICGDIAIKMVREHKVDMLMKGGIHTKELVRKILDKKKGLTNGKPLLGLTLFELKKFNKLIFLTDPRTITYPSLEDKVNMIKDVVEVAHAFGIKNPKVAPLAAIEIVNPKMKETIDGYKLTEMNKNGEIKGCIVDGPLSLDLAIDPTAAQLKDLSNRSINGDADILLVPNIHAGNIAYKILTHIIKANTANLIIGPEHPCIITSRSDTFEVKINTIAISALLAEIMKHSE